jgi:hypothetical protein
MLLATDQFSGDDILISLEVSPVQASINFHSFLNTLILVLKRYEGALSSYEKRWELILEISALFDSRQTAYVEFRNCTTTLRGFSHFNLVEGSGSGSLLAVNNHTTMDAHHLQVYGQMFWLFSGLQDISSVGYNSHVPTTELSLGCILYELHDPDIGAIISDM